MSQKQTIRLLRKTALNFYWTRNWVKIAVSLRWTLLRPAIVQDSLFLRQILSAVVLRAEVPVDRAVPAAVKLLC